MEKPRIVRSVALLVFLSGGITWAQVTTGTILGTVKDSTGGALPGAKVVLLNDQTGISRTVETDAAGRYSARLLSLGNYMVTGSMEGFQTVVRRGIVLTVGREAVVDLTLPVGGVTQTVEVTGEAPLVESTTASLGSLVDDHTIRALPLNGRSYDQLALLQPGVILTAPGPLSGGSYTFGTGKRFSVGGQRSTANSFLLDGTNINDQGNGTPGGAAGTNLGVDTILEFKILTNSFSAELGRSSGSVVTAITRSGTNALHGTAFEYIRNSALDARNFFDSGSSPPSFRRNQFGGVIGGPIKRDKTFFFGGYEGLRERLAKTQIAIVPTQLARRGILPIGTVPVDPVVEPYLNLYPLPNGRDFGNGTAEFLSTPTIVTDQDNFMFRVDHQLNSNTNIFGRYTFDRDSLNDPQEIPGLFGTSASRRQYSTLQANSILGPKALNNIRFAFNRTRSASDRRFIPDPGPQLALIPGQPLGAIRVGGGDLATGTLTELGEKNGPFAWAYNIFQLSDDFSYVTGKHSFKTGMDIQRLQDNTEITPNLRGEYTFRTLSDFLAAKPSRLRASSPLGTGADWGLRHTILAFYGQDDYTVNSRLTLNLGLRWEMTTDPIDVNGKMAILPSLSASETVVSDRFFSVGKKNFQPRVGLAWRLSGSGKTVLRAGGGIYHNLILPWLYPLQTAVPPFFGRFDARNPSSFPDGYRILTEGGGVTLSTVAPFAKTPVSNQYNLSIQHEMSDSAVLQLAYAGSVSSHLPTKREGDSPIPILLPDGRKFFPEDAPRRNPAWSGIRLVETNSNAAYNSLTATLRRRSSSGFQGQVSYSFSKSMDEGSSTQDSDNVRAPNALLDPEDRGRDRGLSNFDARHNFVFDFTYPLPFRAASKVLGVVVNGWTLNGISTFTAGQPFTARLADEVSRNQASDLAERPDLKPGARQNPNEGTTAGCAGIPAGQKLRTADRFYDPCGFSLPLAGTYGNLGRNTIIGPGVANVDLGLEKEFELGERANVTFKAELFNVLNHANFDLPNTNVLDASGDANPAAGRIASTTTSSRQIQFGLRIAF